MEMMLLISKCQLLHTVAGSYNNLSTLSLTAASNDEFGAVMRLYDF